MNEYLKPLDAEVIRPYIALRMARNIITDCFVTELKKQCDAYPKRMLNVKFAEYIQGCIRTWAELNRAKLQRASLMLHYVKANPTLNGDYIVGVRFSNTVSYDHQIRAYYDFANGDELAFSIIFKDKHIAPDAFTEIEQQQTRAVYDNLTLQAYVESGRLNHIVRTYNEALVALKEACGGDTQVWPLAKFFRDHQL